MSTFFFLSCRSHLYIAGSVLTFVLVDSVVMIYGTSRACLYGCVSVCVCVSVCLCLCVGASVGMIYENPYMYVYVCVCVCVRVLVCT